MSNSRHNNTNFFKENSHSTLRKCPDLKSSNKARKARKSANAYITPFTLFSPFKPHANNSEMENYVYITPKNKRKDGLEIKKSDGSEEMKENKNEEADGNKRIHFFHVVVKKIKK